jgi:hypothetical protein
VENLRNREELQGNDMEVQFQRTIEEQLMKFGNAAIKGEKGKRIKAMKDKIIEDFQLYEEDEDEEEDAFDEYEEGA